MTKTPQLYGYNEQSRYLLGKTSKFMPELPKGPKYYQKTKHTRDQGSLEEKYLYTFNTTIYPTILPEAPGFPETFRILSELSFTILSELGEYLILENAE